LSKSQQNGEQLQLSRFILFCGISESLANYPQRVNKDRVNNLFKKRTNRPSTHHPKRQAVMIYAKRSVRKKVGTTEKALSASPKSNP